MPVDILAQFESRELGATPRSEIADADMMERERPPLAAGLQRFGTEALVRALGGRLEEVARPFMPRGVARGMAQVAPRALARGLRGAAQLGGIELPEVEEYEPRGVPEAIGALLGKGAAYGGMAAPIIGAGEALLPAALPEALSSALSAAGAGAVLSPTGERARGALEFAAPTLALRGVQPLAGKAAEALGAALRKVTPKGTYSKIQRQYDEIKSSLGNLFDFVKNEADARGIKNIGELDPEIFENAREYGMRTKSFKKLVDNAETGDYKSVRRLYSKAGDISRKASRAEDWEKKEIFDDIQHSINDALSEHFSQTGNHDLAQWLDAAKGGWRQMKDMYENKYTPKITKLVGPNREVPQTLTPLMKDTAHLNKFMEAHPEIAADLKAAKDLEEFEKVWKKAKRTGAAAGALYLLGGGGAPRLRGAAGEE